MTQEIAQNKEKLFHCRSIAKLLSKSLEDDFKEFGECEKSIDNKEFDMVAMTISRLKKQCELAESAVYSIETMLDEVVENLE